MAIEGFGAKFEYGDVSASFTASTGWTEVLNCMDFTPPESEVGDIKTTSHSNATPAHTYQGGLEEGGEAEVTVQYDKTVYAALYALRRQAKRFRVVFSDGSGKGWDGYVKSVGTEIDIEGLVLMNITTKVSGSITPITAVV